IRWGKVKSSEVEVIYSTHRPEALGRLFFKADPESDSEDLRSMAPFPSLAPRSEASLERAVFGDSDSSSSPPLSPSLVERTNHRVQRLHGRAHPYSARLGRYIMDVDHRAREEMKDNRRLSNEEFARLKHTHCAAALERRTHFPVMSTDRDPLGHPIVVSCPKDLITSTLWWQTDAFGHSKFENMAQYGLDAFYYVPTHHSVTAIQAFVYYALGGATSPDHDLMAALAVMEELGADAAWACVAWRVLVGPRRGLRYWQWRALLDVCLRCEDDGEFMSATHAGGIVRNERVGGMN
ncbi:hypothetical protein BDN72DRAFT_866301, partial [Pluteus cervinus]